MTKLTLKSLLHNVDHLLYTGDVNEPIKGVTIDSRDVQEKNLFIAIPGTKMDGYDFIPQAIRQGATVILSEKPFTPAFEGVSWIEVADARKSASQAAEWFYGFPSRNLTLIGVTGTNGKSSVVYFLHQLFENMGYRAGLFSTIVNKSHLDEMPARLTTPDPISLSRDLQEMTDNGCDFAFMEVSSHALDQHRVSALDFDGAIFTNITHDHLDYHGNFKNYINAKKLFFDQLKQEAFALINVDDRHADYMVQNTSARVKTFALHSLADYSGRILEMDMESMTLLIEGRELMTHITGRFNASNLLAVYAVADQCGLDREEILAALSVLKEVPGRFQRINVERGNITGVVDYAHTPDAVEKVTRASVEIVKGGGKIIIALGCGGNRDKSKRPVMAKTAARNADLVILTSDNPRDEDPHQIIGEMYEGLTPPQKAKVFKIADRREAIRLAVSFAQPGDVVIVAGKGHEQYQEVEGVKYPFDDAVELKAALTEKFKVG